MRTRGFTLLETVITVAVIAILASIAIPQYGRAVQRSYWRTARDILQTIYAGEQVYETDQKTYVDPATCPTPWRCIYTDNPNTPSIPVTYAVGGVTAVAFTATATYTPTGQTQSIDQNRNPGAGDTWLMP